MDSRPNPALPLNPTGDVKVNHQVAGDHDPDEDEVQLQLTLGFTYNSNNEAPPAPAAHPIHHHQNQNDDNDNRHVDRELEPLLFRPLLTPILYSQAPPPPAHSFQSSSSSSSTNPPRRQQPRQVRSSSGGGGSGKKSPTIEPPYPWSTDKRCQVHPATLLKSMAHFSITGRVKCRKCERSYEMTFDLDTMFMKVGSFILERKDELCHRAPEMWMNPVLPDCAYCHHSNAVKPEIEGKKRNTNWLFLFLGQMLGCCTGEQLKYFCKHNGHHRTAAKDRLLYLAYLNICRQLDPHGPFNL